MANSKQFEDELYKNWLVSCLGLKYVKECLEEYVTQEVDLFHIGLLTDVKNDVGSVLPIDCSKQTFLHDKNIPSCYMCNVHKRNINECDNTCHNKICKAIVTYIRGAHRFQQFKLSNTNPCKWTTDPWEVAKCFMSTDGYEKTTSANDTDCAGLLSICINMKIIGTKLKIKDKSFRSHTDIFSVVNI